MTGDRETSVKHPHDPSDLQGWPVDNVDPDPTPTMDSMTKTSTIPARPTTYKGTTMRSRLEAGFAMWLDQVGFTWAYEPECFATERGQWLPDFRVDIPTVTHTADGSLRRGFPTYVEVKPASWGYQWGVTPEAHGQVIELRARMSSTFDSKPDVGLVLAAEGTHPVAMSPDMPDEPVDWTWTGLWPIDARRLNAGPWQGEWWKGTAA